MNNITYDSTSFIINGKKVFLYSGEIHYFRISPQEWRRRLLLAGQAGLNTVSTYIPWNFYEPEKG
ncbi:beta-galactosidase, partial [candidate division KSB1 bacterium]